MNPTLRLALAGLLATRIVLIQTAFGQAPRPAIESPRISALEQDIARGMPGTIDSFWKTVAKEGTPFIERTSEDPMYVLVTFVWRGSPKTGAVDVRGQLTDVDEPDEAERLGDTDLWYESVWMRKDTRTNYKFAVTEEGTVTTHADPLNPKRWVVQKDDFDPQEIHSIVELPDAPPERWVAVDPTLPRGKVERRDWTSEILNNQRHVWIYTPPGYATDGAAYGLLVTSDGFLYTTAVPTPTILDNLIAAKQIPPVVALFVGNAPKPEGGSHRLRELFLESTRFSDLLTKELLPWVRANYHVSNDPGKTIIAGRSGGGLAACLAAWRNPDVFGNVLSQSGSVGWKPAGDVEAEWLARQVATSPRLPIRFYLDAGVLETAPWPNTTRSWKESEGTPDAISLLATNRHLRDVLTAKDYFVEYRERPGGHLAASCQATFFAQGLISLIGLKSRP